MDKQKIVIVSISIIAIIAFSFAIVSGGITEKASDSNEEAATPTACFKMGAALFRIQITNGIASGTMEEVNYKTPVIGKVLGKGIILTAQNPYEVGLGMIDGTIGFPNGNWYLVNSVGALSGPTPVTLVSVSCSTSITSLSGKSAFSN